MPLTFVFLCATQNQPKRQKIFRSNRKNFQLKISEKKDFTKISQIFIIKKRDTFDLKVSRKCWKRKNRAKKPEIPLKCMKKLSESLDFRQKSSDSPTLVEITRFELVASSLRTRRSTNWAISPKHSIIIPFLVLFVKCFFVVF